MAKVNLNGKGYEDSESIRVTQGTVCKPAIRESTFNSLFIRATADNRFEFVVQNITTIGADFTFDERVVLSADTPHELLRCYADPKNWQAVSL